MQGKVALITGVVRRIGRATALALTAEGVARDVAVLGRRALADVNDEAAVEAMMAQINTTFGRIDILVNNAALRSEDDFLDVSFACWRDITGTILDGAFLCSRIALSRMMPRRYGRIINRLNRRPAWDRAMPRHRPKYQAPAWRRAAFPRPLPAPRRSVFWRGISR